MFKRRRKFVKGLSPDEIFIDAQNLTNANDQQMEGFFERPISTIAVKAVMVLFILGGLLILYKMAQLQVVNGADFFEVSENNRLNESPIFAKRGIIYDRNGIELAWNDIESESDGFPKRHYISAPGFGLLGFVRYPKKDGKGFFWRLSTEGAGGGVEEIANNNLKGVNGFKLREVNAHGKVQNDNIFVEPEDGRNVWLSLDVDVQQELYRAIGNHAFTEGYKGGSGVIMEADTGKLLGLATFPDVDPNILTNSENNDEIVKYLNDPMKPFLNRAISGLYVPGSIVKPFLGFEGLRSGVISVSTKMLSIGYIEVPNPYIPDEPYRYRDWREQGHGNVDLKFALADSVNTFFYNIAGGYRNRDGIGIRGIEKVMKDFGIGSLSGIELPGEAIGVIPTPEWKREVFNEPWRLGDTYITAIGQFGYQVTPLSMARALGALVNGGKVLKPSIFADSSIEINGQAYLPQDEAYIKTILEGMRLTVTDGTARSLNLKEIKVGAKTGTAQVGANREFINSWIAGFFPYENPKYVFVIVMEQDDTEDSLASSWVMRNFLDSMIEREHTIVTDGRIDDKVVTTYDD